MQRKFPLLFSPLKVGKLTLRNRIEASATSIHEFDSRDFPTKESIAYYQEKAAGGAAIVTIGETPVHTATGRSHDHAIALDNPDILPVLADLADGSSGDLQSLYGSVNDLGLHDRHIDVIRQRQLFIADGNDTACLHRKIFWLVKLASKDMTAMRTTVFYTSIMVSLGNEGIAAFIAFYAIFHIRLITF